jgi:tetratricopeptide (TPR) repeat protein
MDEVKQPGPPRRAIRLNRRALATVGLAGAVAIAGVVGLGAIRGRSGRSALLLEARRQRDEAKRPDLALGYLNRYLELTPDDVAALDERASLLAGAARDPESVESAIKAHVRLLARGGGGSARKRLARLYLRSEQFRAAEQAARDHLRAEPRDVEAHRLLARALEEAGRQGDARALDEAVAEYEAAEALEPGDIASAERLARLLVDRSGDRSAAVRVLDALLEHNPRSAAARLARARYFAAIGDAASASAEVNEALRLDPTGIDTQLAAADDAIRRNDPAAASSHLDAIGPGSIGDLRVKALRGTIELLDRQPDRAVRDWQDGLALSGGGDAELTWRLAHVLIQLGRPREADPLLAQYRRLIGGNEPSPSCRYLIGLAMLKSGRTAGAIAELEAVRYKVGSRLEGLLYLALGQAYEASPEPDRAVDTYQRATASAATGAAPWLALARLQAIDRPADGVATLERGLAAVGADERLQAALARALWAEQKARPVGQRDWSRLERLLDQAKRTAPGSAELAAIRAELATAKGRPDDGLAVLADAARSNPASAPLALALAEALARLGRIDQALGRLDQAVAAIGDRAGFRIARARYLLAKGDANAAGAALSADPDRLPSEQRPALARAIGEFQLGQGDRAAARRAFLDWATLEPGSIDPHLALLNLAIAAGDDRAVDGEIGALKSIGGPSSVFWKVARAEALLKDRPGLPPSPARLDEATRLAAEVEAETPRQPSGSLLRGRLMILRGRPDEAVRAYQRALDLGGGPRAVGPLAALLTRLGRRDDLAALRARVGELPPEVGRGPTDAEAREALARLLANPADRAKARGPAARAADAPDASIDALRLAAALELADGDLNAAARRVARLEAVAPGEPATIELQARLLKARGKPAEAVALLERGFDAAGMSPGSVELGRGIARLLAGMGEPDAADRVARKVARLGPLGQVVLGEWLASRGQFDGASAAFDAASADPQGAREAAVAALAKASATHEPRWVDLSDRLFGRAIAAGPLDDDSTYALASLRHLQGRLDEAVKVYDDLAARSPAHFSCLNNAAWILSEDLNRPREGLDRIEAVASKGAIHPRTLDTRGVVLLRLGQTNRAIADLEAASARVPSGPICYHLARAYLAAGRRDDAAQAFARASAAGLKPETLQPAERLEFARVSKALK